ncbi:hypothetical protein NDU88_006007 [Pleurodeles waltl]|uniref:Uncharacterized protein n=1 Tax=Pleurodeles waltl TaxID=8319 RepID=A0AAV7RKB3_PLEWA|nr:hypothetical protein NDU88_006007 [Pleurodeles waltl]
MMSCCLPELLLLRRRGEGEASERQNPDPKSRPPTAVTSHCRGDPVQLGDPRQKNPEVGVLHASSARQETPSGHPNRDGILQHAARSVGLGKVGTGPGLERHFATPKEKTPTQIL